VKFLIAVCAGVALAGCSLNPLGAGRGRLSVDPRLQVVMDYIDRETWIHPMVGKPLGQWVRDHAADLVVSDDVAPYAVAWTLVRERRIAVAPLYITSDAATVPLLAAVVLHEVRHLEGYRHGCANGFDDVDATGAWAVHALYAEHIGHQELSDGINSARIGCK
jgi:hypothetical protein